MKKILDFIIIFLLVYLTISLFTGKNEQATPSGNIEISSVKSSYSIPASVGLNITNSTSNDISFNTCNDLKVTVFGEYLNFDNNEFCKDINLKSGEKTLVNYGIFYDKFLNTGNYVSELNIDSKRYISSFDIENKGTISKIFTASFYAPIYNFMIFLLSILNSSLGLAIIVITIIIRIVLLWPQHKMMLSQRKLQAIQPKVKEIQEKHKGNQQMIGMELMALYKKEKVNPMGSCGFLLIQMPILLVIYNVILSINDHSNYYHIYRLLQRFDLTSISYSFLGIDLLSAGGLSGIILALIVAIVQFIQIKLSLVSNKKDSKGEIVLEKKKGENSYQSFMPDPEMMNKFMLFGMPIMVGFFTYTLIAGVGIYWGISTTFMIFQQLIVNKIVKK